ncbi:intercellular adhesion molecule 2 isoform X2 [Amia ocellicauda]|uniref:intercellular adhesion molecule 2 isoform X2 n=1 Tax=Amia ocellicauda TaxID=2972642 RepID=UPI0034646992
MDWTAPRHCAFMALCLLRTAAAAFCPIEINPERVVVKYGDPVSANCTVTRTTRGMGWEASVGSIDMQTGPQSLVWSVSNLTDWAVEPKCYANFDTEPKQCLKKLNILLYKYPDRVSISSVGHTGPMEEGRQYLLQCDVQSIAPVQYLSVNWYRGGALIHTETFTRNTTRTPVNVSPTLPITPNRTDDRVLYMCEAELRLGPEGLQANPVMKSEPLNITVLYEPVLKDPHVEHVLVKHGVEDEYLTCSASGNPAPRYEWKFPPGLPNDQQPQSEEGGTRLHLSPVFPGEYVCNATNSYGTASKTFVVSVEEVCLIARPLSVTTATSLPCPCLPCSAGIRPTPD